MNRRVFVRLGIFSAGAMTFPLFYCRSNDQYNDLLHQPTFLSQICDDKTLREIGLAYLKVKPKEAKINRLVDFLTVELSGKRISSKSSDKELDSLINYKIHNDFEKENIITVKGWLLSLTEARQCALFSLTPL